MKSSIQYTHSTAFSPVTFIYKIHFYIVSLYYEQFIDI